MKHIKKLRMDIDKTISEIIPSVQFDSETRFLHVNLTSGNIPLDLTGCSVKISAIKPDGYDILNDCTIIDASQGFLEVPITEQMNAASGNVKAKLQVYDGEGVLSTRSFYIHVDESTTRAANIVSGNEFKALTEALTSINRVNNKLDTLESKKADTLYVDELVAKKQLEGASVDTSVLTFKSDFEPIKKVVDPLQLFKNNYDSKISTPYNTGGVTTNYVENELEDGYIHISYNHSTSNDTSIYRKLPHLLVDVESVKITVEFIKGSGFVGIGTSFFWGAMTRKTVSKGEKASVILNTKDIPTYSEKGAFGIYAGSANTEVEFKIKYEYYLKSGIITHTNYSDKSTESEYAIKSETSAFAEYSSLAESSKNSGANFIPFNKISTNREGLTLDRDGVDTIFTKPKGLVIDSTWFGLYINIDFNTLEELDLDLVLNYESINGNKSTINNIVPWVGCDWNPANNPISVNINDKINIYKSILSKGQDVIDFYSKRKSLAIVVAVQINDSETLTNSEYIWKIRTYFELPNCSVLATDLTSQAKNNIIEESMKKVTNNIHKIPIGVSRTPIDKYVVRESNTGTSGLTVISQKDKWINVKKESTKLGTKYGGVYIKFEYDKFEDLDGTLIVDYNHISGPTAGERHILYGISDWGGSTSGNVNFQLNTEFNPMELLGGENLSYRDRNYFYISVLSYNPNGVEASFEFDVRVRFKPENAEDVCATELTEELMDNLRKEFASITSGEPYITCWGDSLTAGGGWTSKIQELTGIKVYNGGTGGETSRTIMARQGGDIMLVNNITIPSTTDPVTIATRSSDTGITTYFGHKVTPLLQGGSHINPCYIGDVKGTLRWTGSAHNDMTGIWTFTRAEVGDELVINRPTAIRTDFDINRNKPKIMIIFIGQNGGYTDTSDLINQHRLMIEHSKAENFIVLGLSSGTASQRSAYEEAMRKEFGRRFISLREYLSTYGLDDAGIEPTEQDLAMMAQGQTPQSLLSDSVHYNSACKTVIGSMIYKKIRELNII